MSPSRKVTVADIERALFRAFPAEWAEEWDRNGLLCGDGASRVGGVLVTLDPTREAIRRATKAGANVLVTHHPAFIETPSSLRPGPGPAGVVYDAVRSHVALINAHTNLDRAPVAHSAIAGILGLKPLKPIERGTQPMALITTFAPRDSLDRVRAAMISAGAGRVGEYEGAAFVAQGIGRFTPRQGSRPALGTVGEDSVAEEARIEMVAPCGVAGRVVSAARDAHPYEEPLVVVSTVEIARSIPGMGMLCRTAPGTTLQSLARAAARRFSVKPRIWGDPQMRLDSVVTATGSAGSLVGDVIAAGAQALVAGEVRYHDALGALDAGIAVIELGHDVSEWPLTSVLADAVRTTQGLDPALVSLETPRAGWWTP